VQKSLTIAELREIGKKMTPGPWAVPADNPAEVVAPCPCCGLIATCEVFGPPGTKDPLCYNSEGIAAMRNLWPFILDQLEAAEKQRDEYKAEWKAQIANNQELVAMIEGGK
jgi:hypothetical protein